MNLSLPLSFNSSPLFMLEAVFISEQITECGFGALLEINDTFSFDKVIISCRRTRRRLGNTSTYPYDAFWHLTKSSSTTCVAKPTSSASCSWWWLCCMSKRTIWISACVAKTTSIASAADDDFVKTECIINF